MGLVPSQFNAPVEHGGQRFIVNTKTQHVLPPPQAQRLERGGPFTRVEEGLLARQGFLVSDRVPEVRVFQTLFLRRKFTPQQAGLSVAPTLRCNCACPDCPQNPYDRSDVLSAADLQATLRALDDQLTERRPVDSVLWLHGGEPFVAHEECLRLAEGAREIGARHGTRLTVGIVTNGTLLHRRASRRLLEAVDYTYVTLAENRRAHGEQRPYVGGKNSYDDVLRGLAAAAAAGKEIQLRFNVATPQRLRDHIPATVADVLRALGGEPYERIKFEFNLLQPLGKGGGCVTGSTCKSADGIALSLLSPEEDDAGVEAMEAQLGELADHLPWPRSHFDVPAGDRYLRPPLDEGRDLPLCSYQRGSNLYVGPTGHLYTCAPFAGDPRCRVGHVSRRLSRNWQYLSMIKADPFGDPTCLACPYVPLCIGDCAFRPARRLRWATATCKEENERLLRGYLAFRDRQATARPPAAKRRTARGG